LWLHRKPTDWDRVVRLLEASGVKTAAWAVLMWVKLLSTPHTGDMIDSRLRTLTPGCLRRRYIAAWLRLNLKRKVSPEYLFHLLGFSLLLHDRPANARAGLRGWWAARVNQRTDASVFDGLR
jgi:hypothetical protein